jgi:drug/metabolite transporter (DMT)-like permease
MKLVSAYINPLHALAIRGFFLLLLNSIVIHINSFTLDVKDPGSKLLSILAFRIVMHRMFWSSLTVSMFLAPLKYIPAGTANALFNLAPIIVCFV